MIDLWMFLTIAAVVYGIVEIYQHKTKIDRNKSIESSLRSNKKLEERLERLEQRIGNLETIVVDENQGEHAAESGSGTFDRTEFTGEPGKLSNSLRK